MPQRLASSLSVLSLFWHRGCGLYLPLLVWWSLCVSLQARQQSTASLCSKVKGGSCRDIKRLCVSTPPLWSIYVHQSLWLMTLWGCIRLVAPPTFLTFQLWQEMTVSPQTSALNNLKVCKAFFSLPQETKQYVTCQIINSDVKGKIWTNSAKRQNENAVAVFCFLI